MWEGREQSAGEPCRYGSQPERTASCGPPAAPARIPDPGRYPYLALPKGSGLRAAPRPPPSLAPGGTAPSRSKPAPRLCCRSERPRREQGSETEGAGEGGSACGGEAARAGEESPASPTLPGQSPPPRLPGCRAHTDVGPLLGRPTARQGTQEQDGQAITRAWRRAPSTNGQHGTCGGTP